MSDKIRSYIGLCRAAGGIVTGFDLVLGEIRRRRAVFVIIAADASERTKKQITDKCKYYQIKYFLAGFTSEELSQIIGKKSSCVAAAFTGEGPCKPLLSMIETTEDSLSGNENAAMTERMIVDGN